MRKVETRSPSFPDAPTNKVLEVAGRTRWQVLCGDAGHWRVGIFSPPETSVGELTEFEQHDCPEFFALMDGRMTLVMIVDGRMVEKQLRVGEPILVTHPHSAYCPDGPHSATCLVVERDSFETIYKTLDELGYNGKPGKGGGSDDGDD
ncbi:MAG: hypothetical protein H6684_16975 [Deltaproteobacteria bacterium]|nr:hypothetical protein [Deltaproteobacteria bacterium]MCB9490429.1 hypothetical protein [Deltaproteobacteria bacterium]